MKRVFLLIGKDFKRKWKNPVVIIGFLLIPILFTFIFGFIFGSSQENVLPTIKVLSVDLDKSLVSRLYLSSLTQGELKDMIHLQAVPSEDEARSLLDKGKASALIIIPSKFGEKVWSGDPAEITLIKNPSEQFLPQIAEEITETTSLVFSALLQIFSEEISQIKALSEQIDASDQIISDLSIMIKDRIEGIEKYVFPPVVSIKQVTREKEVEIEDAGYSIHSYILPAISIMFILFICNIVFEDLLREKEKGTLLRMTISPLRISEFIWSKILTSALIGIFCTLFLIGLGSILFSIDWGRPGILLIIILSLNILIAGFIAFLYTFIRTERQAGALMSSVIVVMALLGGSMTPISNFPPFVQKISRFTVNYWGLEAFKKNIIGDSVPQIWVIVFGMLIMGLLLSIASSFLLKNKLKKGLYG
ncbi:MAG: ABC transporter permease [Candidatus Aminicenantes bacterium]